METKLFLYQVCFNCSHIFCPLSQHNCTGFCCKAEQSPDVPPIVFQWNITEQDFNENMYSFFFLLLQGVSHIVRQIWAAAGIAAG